MNPENTNQPTPPVPIAPVVPAPVSPISAAPVTTVAVPVTGDAPVPGTEGPTPSNPQVKKLNLPDMKNLPSNLKRIPLKFKIMGGFVLLLIVLLLLVSFTKPGKRVKELILPTTSPIPASTPVEQVLIPTQYATDPEVLDIEKTMAEFDSKLGSTDLKEDSLRVPNLDFVVSFKGSS